MKILKTFYVTFLIAGAAAAWFFLFYCLSLLMRGD